MKDEKVIEPEIIDEQGQVIETDIVDATKEDNPRQNMFDGFGGFGNFKTYQFKSANPILGFFGLILLILGIIVSVIFGILFFIITLPFKLFRR